MNDRLPEVGGWDRIVKSDICRPHVPVARFPPETGVSESWRPVAQRHPLGLSPDQAWRANFPPAYVREMDAGSDLLEQARVFMKVTEENLAAWDALPPGTLIHGCFCGQPHPVEMYR